MGYLKHRTHKEWLFPVAAIAGFGMLGSGSTLRAAETPIQSPNATATLPANARQGVAPSFTDNDNNTYTIGADGKLIKTAPPQKADNPVFAAFSQWMVKYNAATAPQKAPLEAEGVKLATERRAILAGLIESDPARAVELSIGLQQRESLPTAIVQQLEEVVQGRGAYSILNITRLETVPIPGKPGETQKVTRETTLQSLSFGGRTYTAHVYGKREGLLSKTELPFHGIAIDDKMAINENPIWILKPGQAPPPGATPGRTGTKCPVCGQDAADGLVGVVGSTLYYFDTQQDLMKFAQKLWDAEYEIGPQAHG